MFLSLVPDLLLNFRMSDLKAFSVTMTPFKADNTASRKGSCFLIKPRRTLRSFSRSVGLVMSISYKMVKIFLNFSFIPEVKDRLKNRRKEECGSHLRPL